MLSYLQSRKAKGRFSELLTNFWRNIWENISALGNSDLSKLNIFFRDVLLLRTLFGKWLWDHIWNFTSEQYRTNPSDHQIVKIMYQKRTATCRYWLCMIFQLLRRREAYAITYTRNTQTYHPSNFWKEGKTISKCSGKKWMKLCFFYALREKWKLSKVIPQLLRFFCLWEFFGIMWNLSIGKDFCFTVISSLFKTYSI